MKQEVLNGSLVESAINTLTTTQVEVPNSTGAKVVMLDYVELDLTPPLPVAATTVQRDAIALAGKLSPSSALLSEAGAVAARHITLWNEAGAAVAAAVVSLGEEPMASPVLLLQDPTTRKYYVTLAIKGTAEGVGDVGTIHYHMRFRVM
jgi:hypothetical protein